MTHTQEDIFRGADFDKIFKDIGFGFGDFFRPFFGGGIFGGGFPERAGRGRDLLYDLTITLEEAATGTEREIDVARAEKCSVCGGSGAAPGTEPKTCPRCGGQGSVQQSHKSDSAVFVRLTPCPECKGKGKIVEKPCENCRGSGLIRKVRKITVKVLVGIDDGYQLRLRGEGETIADGKPGDLYVLVRILPHRLFIRSGDDLYHPVLISFPRAVLGTEVRVPTLEGPISAKIRPGTQPGEIVRIRGKGMPRFRGRGKGNLLIRVGVNVPEKITSRQRELLEQLERTFGEETRPLGPREGVPSIQG